jgi:hypothetical protein
MLNHKTTCDQFKVFFAKFDSVYTKLKQRDKSLDTFKHYFEKTRKLKEERQFRNSNSSGSASVDTAKLAKEEERL